MTDNRVIIAPFLKQCEATEAANTHFFTLYGGAIRGGKTYWLILLIWTYALFYKKSRWAIVRATNPVLEETTIVSLQTLLDRGLSNDVKKWDKSVGCGTITLHNGSQIIFMAESFDTDKDLNRWKGLEVNGFGVDEMNEIRRVTFLKMIERAGSWQHSPGCPMKIIGTCNPTHNWVKTDVYDKWKDHTLPDNWAYVPAKITDNPHIDELYLESLKSLPAFQYQCFVEGDWDAMPRTGGEFYKLFNHEVAVKPCTYNPEEALHLTWDFNVNPYMTCNVHQITVTHVLVNGKTVRTIDCRQIAEICLESPNNTTKATCDRVKMLYPGHAGGMIVYGDPTGVQEDTRSEKGSNDFTIIVRELAMYKPSLRISKAAPAVVMRGNFLNTVFFSNYGNLRLSFNNEVSSGCTKCDNTINDYLYLKEDSDGTKKKELIKNPDTQVTYQKYGHTSDANDYFYCMAFADIYASYQRGGTALPLSLGKNYTRHKY